MANQKQLALLRQGAEAWNEWREEHLEFIDLRRANLVGANLIGANLSQAFLNRANLSEANLSEANLTGAKLVSTNLIGAKLIRANLGQANLIDADLTRAELIRADLRHSLLLRTNLEAARLKDCGIYGISTWDIRGTPTEQTNLILTPENQPAITVDELEIAQFIYLLLSNSKVRSVIDTMTTKVVLILGRFSNERKPILDAIRDELRKRNYIPILFDFDKPASKDLTGTVETLARMARFIIADLTDPSSIPHELATVVPHLRTTPVLPLRLAGSGGYSMFGDLQRAYSWVLPTHEYADGGALIAELPAVIAPADKMAIEFRNAA